MMVVVQFIAFYQWVILARILLSWVRPNPNHPAVAFLLEVTDPYLNWVRSIVPPALRSFGMLDLTPLFAFMILGLAATLLGGGAR